MRNTERLLVECDCLNAQSQDVDNIFSLLFFYWIHKPHIESITGDKNPFLDKHNTVLLLEKDKHLGPIQN